MTDRSIAKRTKLWTRRGGSIRYRWHERCGDWWCATRDAKAGTPAAPVQPEQDPAGTPAVALGKAVPGEGRERRWGTPRTVVLGQLGRARAEREWVLFHADTADLQIERAQARARRAAAQELLSSTREQLMGSKTPDAGEAQVAAPGEENADPEVRSGRRHAERAARARALQERERGAQQSVEEADVEIARLDEQIRIRREVAEVRAAMIEAYVRRRCSAYLTRLVRKHPDGERVGSLIRTDWEQRPSWLQDAAPTADGGR